ncbi:tetratricopeptide repeat protein [Muricauda sp. MAR_2010_75]|uniref:tetratricopeptide repeat protein n=1 Tax=Allomuricauda sp. MAR_2010_75 TaxID=1250232 RepID=UPI00055DBDF9|nr:tetratricopeptide repeat protein [Muricauda sp. MAR_2010_75]
MDTLRLKYILLSLATIVLLSCKKESDFITQKDDYDRYLAAEPVKTTSKYFELWDNKIKSDSLQLLSLGNVAGEYNRFFQSTGDIKYLKMAEQSLQKAVDIAAVGKAGYYRALARNYISQHRFREALELAEKARSMGSGVNVTQGLLFDVHMELGNFEKANAYLDSIGNMSDFGYLIRLAKWNDHKGDLDTAIRFMEKAVQKAESSKNKSMLLWSYTNLADFYGHAERIEDSYQLYIKALQLDPQNAYAKKGIAWIVYSHERNGREALRILDSILMKHQSPEYYLLKAEITEFMGNEALKLEALDNYYKKVQNNNYGDMYNAHNVDFYLDMEVQEKAMKLAKKEVENRPTPESYGLLAYSYYKKGEKEKALELLERHIAGKTFEPTVLTQAAEIYKANGNLDKVRELKQELKGAAYELGPVKESQILNL